MKKLPISVYYILKDEEERLPTSLDSVVEWADEIIAVIDPRTKDKTEEIAKKYGAKIFHKDWEGFAQQKLYAEQQCTNKWVFNLDADEEVTQELKAELQKLFTAKELPVESGFKMRWVDLYPGQTKVPAFAFKDKILRLYNTNYAGVEEIKAGFQVQDRPKVREGKVGVIKADVIHRPILNFSQLEIKIIRYSEESALANFEKGKKISTFKLWVDFPFKFFKYYILRRMCVYGWYGLVISVCSAYRNFMRLAKTKELYAIESEKKK
jgi:glycosyltransferase involved in cell wall biosynthesis